MNKDTIRAFLTVVEQGSISRAANVLYTTQGNISKKIVSLETELGVPLVIRSKGVHQIELTSYGEAFLKTARQMDILYKDMDTIAANPDRKFLSIGAVDSLSNIRFHSFLEQFVLNHPDICVSIHAGHSSYVYTQMSNHFIDIGFTKWDHPEYTDIKTSLLTAEPFVIVTRGNDAIYEGMDASELPVEKELYMRSSLEFEAWHEHLFPGKQYLMRLGTDVSILPFLDIPGTWALLQEENGRILHEAQGLQYYHVNGIPLSSKTYEIEHIHTRASRVPQVELFKKELHEYLNISD